MYTRFSNYNILEEIEKDNYAAGLVYASIFLSIAYLYSRAINGDITSWSLTIENILYVMVFGLIILPVSRWIVEKIILPKTNLNHEIINQEIPNKGAAIIEAFAYIGSAVLIGFCI